MVSSGNGRSNGNVAPVAGCGVPLPSGVEAAHEQHLDTLRPWPGSRPSVRQVHEADAHAVDYKGEAGFDPRPVGRS